MTSWKILWVTILVVAFPVMAHGQTEPFTFAYGDRIAILGNTLPDRMQHHGWLESNLQLANPDKELVIRNMGFSGDQVAYRPREENFPSANWYLRHIEANVVFAFFGYNESYSRDPEKFKDELRSFIDSTRRRKYDGENKPRIVLFSPIAHENLNSPNFPDGVENNLWLSIYTDAMARVAQEEGVYFVDLYAPTRAAYDEADEALTINGIHLTEQGNRIVARIILEALGQEWDEAERAPTRAAVLDKNWHWFNRYRATDGNDVWGNRSTLAFVDGQTNAEVLQHELVMLDIMSANRDKVIWAAAQGKQIEADDSNVPDPVPVDSNFQPSRVRGLLEYTTPEEAVDTLTLEEGMKANLFASEKMFPELVNPVQMDVDPKGRLWVAAWQTYPKWQPDREMLDRLLILPDEDGDGVADEAITFAYVHNPTGFTFWNDGVIVCSAPNIFFMKDTTGDDRADHIEILFSGLDSADTHHSPNNFDYGPDGYIYYQRGVFNVSNVETPWEAAQASNRTGMYRFNPRTHRFSFHAVNSPNPHGGDFNYWGYHFATDATTGRAFQVRKAEEGAFAMHEMFEKKVRPVASSGILSSTHFPEKNNGNFIILNTIGFLGIKQYRLEEEDGEFIGIEDDDLLVSSDPNFRPTDFKVGADGALYVADWANAIIGHMQHNIRDPNRDDQHGRIFRITVEGRPLEEPVAIAGEPIEALLEVLKHPTNGVRLRARTELSGRDTDAVIKAAQAWIQQFDPSDPAHAHHLLEALWLHQQHNVVNEGLLSVLLNSEVPHARHAAERVQYLWELEGQLGETAHAMAGHGRHGAGMSMNQDELAQEKSPEPAMDGDTLVVHIHTLKEQMKYDREAFAVSPGMKVRLVFSNPDYMDHNLLIVEPDSASQVAMAAGMLGAEGIEQEWIPESDKILVASGMLSVGESETLEFTAPETLGVYDYVCTYPGHWMLMNGKMHVVEDWTQWTPEESTARDTSAREFVQEWTVADLEDDLHKLDEERSIARGMEIFQEASCHLCHLPTTPGEAEVRPNLADVGERLDARALLTEVLAPSEVVQEQYQSWEVRIETDDFFEPNVLYGQVIEEGEHTIRVISNPLVDAEGVRLERSRVISMEPAPLSIMPTGMLNTYTEAEILDLLAFLQSGQLTDMDITPAE